MSRSGQSSITALSGKHSRRRRRSSQTCPDDGFKEALYVAFKELNMNVVPSVRSFAAEPQPWILRQDAIAPHLDVSSATRRTSKQGTETTLQPDEADFVPIVSRFQEIQVVCPAGRSGINTLMCKHFAMTDYILGALQKSLPQFQTLKTLRLEFCRLTLEQLKAVKSLLVQNPNVVDVSLNGNDIPKQPYHILLKNTRLLHLSLKFCKISEKGTSKLNGPLSAVTPQYLLTLNLSSNMISDRGAKHLADALRSNRTLTHLNLTDNQITDVGAAELMKVFRKFPLNHDEVVLRRERNLHHLLLRDEIRYDLTKTKTSDTGAIAAKRSCSSARMRMAKGFDRASNSSQKRRSSADSYKSITSLIEAKLPKDPHPYMHECTEENKEVYCRGNLHLEYLNLSYNKITDEGLQLVRDSLKEQQLAKVLKGAESGLSKVVLEGNNIKNVDVLSGTSTVSGHSSRTSRSSTKEKKSLSNRIVL